MQVNATHVSVTLGYGLLFNHVFPMKERSVEKYYELPAEYGWSEDDGTGSTSGSGSGSGGGSGGVHRRRVSRGYAMSSTAAKDVPVGAQLFMWCVMPPAPCSMPHHST